MAALPPYPRIALLLLLALVAGASGAGVQLDAGQDSRELADRMVLVKGQEISGWQEALARLRAGDSVPLREQYPGLGYIDEPHWFALELRNDTARPDWLLETATPFTDQVELFLVDGDGALMQQAISGDRVAFSRRPMAHPHIVFPLRIPPGETVTALLRVDTENALDMPATLYSPEGFRAHAGDRGFASGVYFGIVAIMCLYNLLIFFSIRDISYLFYVIYLGLFGLVIFARNGLALQWFWPEQPWWNHNAQPLLMYLTMAFSLFFANSFLGIKQSHPRLHRTLLLLALAAMAAAPLTLLDFSFSLHIAGLLFLPSTLGLIALAALRSREGFTSARYFLFAFVAVGITVALFGLRTLELIEGGRIMEDLLPASTALEALLLSFALAHRMTSLKKENEAMHRQSRQELETRVDERTRELNQALSARSQFLATISHEVRTPLNGILGNVDMVRDEGVSAGQEKHLRIIKQSGEILLQLINDILDYSRIEAGKMTLEQRRFDLCQLAEDSIALFEREAEKNGDRLTLSLGGTLGRNAFGDALRVRQVVANLISNAVKFTRGGQIHVDIQRDSKNPEYVIFTVRDTGRGIEESKQNRLFEHFHQIDSSTSRRYGGSGLGLAISKQLVEIMGGEIGVSSRPGQGSRFWFRIPLAETGVEAEHDIGEEGDEYPQTAPARILVVDDNQINLMVADGLCRKLGHQVVAAESGTEALAALIDDPRGFDLVLMDCEMPEMDGFETTGRIHRLQAEGRVGKMPVVALTAHAIAEKIHACREAGMVAHVAKPVNLEKLKRAIYEALSEMSHATGDQQRRQAD